MTVGNSWHTITKHSLKRRFVAREVGAANHIDWIHRLVWIDLTAGDAIPRYDAEWHEACSPGILAHHAIQARKPVIIDLYEKDPDTFGKLIASLDVHLPMLGYTRETDHRWRLGDKVWLRAVNGDGRQAPIAHLERNDAALILSDPNAITDWPMRRGFAQEIDDRCKGLRILSTLGCNVCGIMRFPLDAEGVLPLGETVMSLKERRNWFRLIEEQEAVLPRRHDLMLAAFERDSAKWAYLLWTPTAGRWRAETENDVRTAFRKVGRAADIAWFRLDQQRFEQAMKRLFLTGGEFFEETNTPLWGNDD